MRKHITDKRQDNLMLSLFKTNENHLTILGDIEPDEPIILIEFIVKLRTVSSTYNIDPSTLSQLQNEEKLTRNKGETYCLVCGETTTDLLQHNDYPNHHYHEKCLQELINTIRSFVNENSSRIAQNNI